ncbi:MAG: glycoside hydrolase family 15 protein [Acidobacteria bacterium]|nr:glycoside hydrolase family 15 protein [Acidobacteriota bacterium]MBI3279731.1 glycoside hydrolase family 15 protein [Acidobacteriota bacterium]
MPYLPIEDYGIIGNLQTTALVGKNGSIDWLCYPYFDSPSVFARILDERKGGFFSIHPVLGDGITYKQHYWPDTNVLVTRFLTNDGVAEIVDYMPVGAPRQTQGFHGLIRRVKVVRGRMTFRMECCPAFNYGRDRHNVELVAGGGAKFFSRGLNLGLAADYDVTTDGAGVFAEFTLADQQTASFEVHQLDASGGGAIGVTDEESAELFALTVEFWRNWISRCTYKGRWREIVYRSALLLKLLVFEKTGAIVAAPTTSLPEVVGGERNWDYRFTWVRDAAFTIYTLLHIGFTEEATRFMDFLEARCRELEPDDSLQIMYGIDGRHDLEECVLDHLEGYKGSSPVRIGNGAHNQLQLDIYGELMDSVYLYNKWASPISAELWTYLRKLVNWVCKNWRRKDEGIWEIRSGAQHFTYSRLMCWVAIDRALRLADKRSFPADRERWLKVRDEIYDDIMENGWSRKRNAFVQYYGSDTLDAALLMMPLVFFTAPGDPRMLSTIDAIMQSPIERGLVSDSLVYRYNTEESPDGLRGREGTFNICTFWLVDALTRAGRVDRSRLDQARLIFERMLGYANHVGLFAEQTGPTGEALGNFPQAFTHLALISAAYNLDRALGGERIDEQF